VHQRLLDWYALNARDLPWRRTRDPYAILVAEVMLQQTQVDRVIPKWHAWLRRFPTLADLASAATSEAIRQWQGLGYNVRAVRLRAIACQTVEQDGGLLPDSLEGLLALKGIGRYTAGAVACFAFEQPVAMVDTNVRRVLSRVFGVRPVCVADLAERAVPPGAAYAWNQALMDLGATLCRATQPLCLVCPLVSECAGPDAPMAAVERVHRHADDQDGEWAGVQTLGSSAPGSPAQARAARAARPGGIFEGSSRYYRGRIVDTLRALCAGSSLPLHELAARVAPPADQARVIDLTRRLDTEGLLTIELDQRVHLPD
jgi:A/G-specific adenine glycosylase